MNELVVINPKDYGLEQTKADEIAEAFREPLTELAELETEYKEFANLTGEPPQNTCDVAKALKQKYVKNRKVRETIHKTEKAYFWNAGKYVDAWKNKALEVSEERETKLSEIADYYINLEKERIEKLAQTRESELLKYQDPEMTYIPPELGKMDAKAWEIYLSGVKREYEEKQAAIKKAEQERIEKEKAEKAEQERIRKENERLKKEAEAREKEVQKERAEMEKKLEAEKKERERIENERQAAIEKEQREAEAKAEAARKAAAAPDKEKIKQAIDYISSFPLIKVQTSEAQEIIEYIESQLKELCTWIFKEMQEL